jgi:hypothetical protein
VAAFGNVLGRRAINGILRQNAASEKPLDNLSEMQSLGFSLPSPAYLTGAILFGLIGFAAFRYGKTSGRPIIRWLGFTLMAFPYVVPQTWLMYLIGAGLCIALYWYRD